MLGRYRGKFAWVAGLTVLLCGGQAMAAPDTAEIAIGSPLPNSLVAGRVTLSLAYNSQFSKINAFTILVDDKIHSSHNFLGMSTRGVHYLDLDTRMLPDGNHTIKIIATGGRGVLGSDGIDITVRNGVPGGPDLVPPQIQFRGFQDGDRVAGKIRVDILAEDNSTTNLLVSLFVNKQVSLLRDRPPYFLDLDTAKYLDPRTNKGTIQLEAWAYDKAQNEGRSRIVTLNVVTPDELNPGDLARTPVRRDDLTAPVVSTPGPVALPAARGPESLTPDSATGMIIRLPDGMRPRVVHRPRGGSPAPNPLVKNPAAPGAASGTSASAAGPAIKTPAGRPLSNSASRTPVVSSNPDAVPVHISEARASGGSRTARPGMTPPARSTVVGSSQASDRPQPVVQRGAGSAVVVLRPRLPQAPPSTKAVATGARGSLTPAAAGPLTGASATGSARLTAPGQRPATLMASASARPKNPEIVRPRVGTAPSAPMASPGGPRAASPSARIDTPARSVPVVAESPSGRSNPMPVPVVIPEMNEVPARMARAMPMISPVIRSATPETRSPRRPPADEPGSEAVIVTMPREVSVSPTGKVDLNVYRIPLRQQLPKDRAYRVAKGETLAAIATRFGVTPRSIQVANALKPGALTAGDWIRVPGTFQVALNNQKVAFDVAPRISNGLPLAPIRQIFEHAGGVVVWYEETREVRAATASKDVKLRIGSKEARVNQMVVLMDQEAFIDAGRTIVPMNFIQKALDMVAEYDTRTGTINLVRR